MSISFSVGEILDMAVEIEHNGAKFYRQAADKASDQNIENLFLNMAKMEDGHEKTFAAMKEQLSKEESQIPTFDPNDEAMLYLKAMADSKGTEGKKGKDEDLTGNESAAEVLQIAIKAEKDSVVFYSGLKNLVPADAGRDKVENIIKEELGHISLLNLSLIGLN